MASFHERHPSNVCGAIYVDCTCLDCDLCRSIAPDLFARDVEHGVAYVYRQPNTPEEWTRCREAIAGCPCESIGSDGEEHDWSEPPTAAGSDAPDNAVPRECRCHLKDRENGQDVD